MKFLKSLTLINSFATVIILMAILGFGFSAFLMVKAMLANNLFHESFCLDDECLRYFKSVLTIPIRTGEVTVNLMVATATIGGIFIALRSYISNLSNSALANHIAHFSIFNNYLNAEIQKHEKIPTQSIEVLSWYNKIFTLSRSGSTDVSKSYIDFINDLNKEIDFSNDQASKATAGSFRYRDHQKRIIGLLKNIEIQLYFLPRNDFYEVEGEIFTLIQKVNRSFCFTLDVPNLKERLYI